MLKIIIKVERNQENQKHARKKYEIKYSIIKEIEIIFEF